MDGTVIDVSSTELRAPRNTAAALLDPKVRAYAEKHGLYVSNRIKKQI